MCCLCIEFLSIDAGCIIFQGSKLYGESKQSIWIGIISYFYCTTWQKYDGLQLKCLCFGGGIACNRKVFAKLDILSNNGYLSIFHRCTLDQFYFTTMAITQSSEQVDILIGLSEIHWVPPALSLFLLCRLGQPICLQLDKCNQTSWG